MQNNWVNDLELSIRAMESIKETVLPELISGKIMNVEGSNNEVLLTIDTSSGIDYLRVNDIGVQGIAARVQFGTAYNSFTIRFKRSSGAMTEYEKRKKQIEEGYFYPAYTLQAYFDDAKSMNLLSIGVIDTKILYKEIENNPSVKYNVTRSDGNIFKYILWKDIYNKQFLRTKFIPKIETLSTNTHCQQLTLF